MAYKKKVGVKKPRINREYILKNIKSVDVSMLEMMLSFKEYVFRVKRALYERSELSPKDFLFSNSIYNKKLVTRNKKKELVLVQCVQDVYKRFELAYTLIENSDSLLYFLLSNDDDLYKTFFDSLSIDDKEKKDHILSDAVGESMKRIGSIVVNENVISYIENDKRLMEEYTKKLPV